MHSSATLAIDQASTTLAFAQFKGFQAYENTNESSAWNRTSNRTPGQQEAPQSYDIRGLVTFVGGLDEKIF
jgi:hypothetical protein